MIGMFSSNSSWFKKNAWYYTATTDAQMAAYSNAGWYGNLTTPHLPACSGPLLDHPPVACIVPDGTTKFLKLGDVFIWLDLDSNTLLYSNNEKKVTKAAFQKFMAEHYGWTNSKSLLFYNSSVYYKYETIKTLAKPLQTSSPYDELDALVASLQTKPLQIKPIYAWTLKNGVLKRNEETQNAL